MATAAQRAQKKDLGPDWRETLAASIRGFVRKTFGLALIALSVALAVALVTHSSTDPSLSTAAGGPPTNWLGAFGAYSSDAMLFLFGSAIRQGVHTILRVRSGADLVLTFSAAAYLVMYLVFAYVDIAWDTRSMVTVAVAMAICSEYARLASGREPARSIDQHRARVPAEVT